MMQAHRDPARASDPHALPDLEVFQLTSEEAAMLDEDATAEACKRFPLANMNFHAREKALAWVVSEYGDGAGWYWRACLPGCLPDGPPFGPFPSAEAALEDAREGLEESDR